MYSTMPLNPSIQEVKETAKEQLNSVKLSENDQTILKLDDFVRSAVLDPIFEFGTSKWFQEIKTVPEHVKDEIKGLIKFHVYGENKGSIRDTICALLSLYFNQDPRLKQLVTNYMQLFDVRSGFTAARCHEFETEQRVGLKLIATKKWEVGELLNSHNFDVVFSQMPPGLNEYSVSRSSSAGHKDKIWLGPSSICNHSCIPNVGYENYEKKTLLKVKKTIEIGEEITVNYGNQYFPKCECISCKSKPTDSNTKKREDTAEVSSKNLLPKRTRVANTSVRPLDCQKQLAESYVIYKRMFEGVDYPKEIRKRAESAENKFTLQFFKIGKPEIISPLATFASSTKDAIHQVHISETLFEKDPLNYRLTKGCFTNAGKLIDIGTMFMSGPEKLKESHIDDLKDMQKFIDDMINHKTLMAQQQRQEQEEAELLKKKNAIQAQQLEEAGIPQLNTAMVNSEANRDPDSAENQNDHFLYQMMTEAKAKTEDIFHPIIMRAFDGPTKQLPVNKLRKRKVATKHGSRKVQREKSPESVQISDVYMRVNYNNDVVKMLHLTKRPPPAHSATPSTSANSGGPPPTENQRQFLDVLNFCLDAPFVME